MTTLNSLDTLRIRSVNMTKGSIKVNRTLALAITSLVYS